MKHIDRVRKIRFSDLKNASVSFWVFIAILLLTALMFLFDFQEYIKTAVISYGLLAIFIISIIADLSIQPVGPDVPLVYAILFTDLNPIFVIFTVLSASAIAIIIAYYVGNKIGATGTERIVGKKRFNKIQNSKNYGKWYLLISAISPIPYIPYLSGLFHLSFPETLKFLVIPRFVRFTVVFIIAIQVGPAVIRWIMV